MAELTPVLCHYLHRSDTDSIHGYWPMDIGMLLEAFGNFVLQRQLYGLYSDVLPGPELHAALHTFFEQRPTDQELWQGLLLEPWPCSSHRPPRMAADFGIPLTYTRNIIRRAESWGPRVYTNVGALSASSLPSTLPDLPSRHSTAPIIDCRRRRCHSIRASR